ncbi:NADP-dependent malic enzyme isoform X1 [Brienomyrus brachyistius]|uniref:NADP-dependent malic enzyme isoform X1 n=3 Tax=Brienomyrus brachyistius TaxID=42636 RepID=UPI0020B25F4C|nr:NADP-dependent malic enzyme isoform X1 [Brienomyrus brachyistius]
MAHGSAKRDSPEWEMSKSGDQGKTFIYAKKRGYEVTRTPHLNKGMAFTLEERLQLGIHGLLPPCFISQDVQLLRVLRNYEMKKDDLDRYVFLMGLQDRNEKLFYRVLTSDLERFMPIVYTPTVGLACQQYGLIFRRPRGLFISIHDRFHISTLLQSWPENDIRAVVVTDGERILGLGDLGTYGMGIPVGKLALYTACGGVPPQHCLPVMLDVGTDNQTLLNDPLYIGLRQKRVRGQAYDDLLDEFMKAVTDRYGINCLIQFEDFANTNAFRLLDNYRNKYCTFNDDIQGTAAVAVAGLLTALRITKSRMSDHTIVFQGAGEAAMGIADLITKAMEKEGLPPDESLRKIWMVDSKGLIVKARGHLTHEKERFAREHAQMARLEDVVRDLKPTVIIGVAAIAGAFTEQIIKDMASFNKRPIIFALSNPTSKAECTAEQCYRITEGRGIFASGSPFDPVTLPDGRCFFPGQGNNAYVFPGLALGIVACSMRHIPDAVFLTTAEAIAEQVTEKDLSEGRLYPPLTQIREVSCKLAVKVVQYAYEHQMAALSPEPEDKEALVRSLMYSTDYEDFVADSYQWPADAMNVQTCKL